jgi:amino acid adenylation domain-containing protein
MNIIEAVRKIAVQNPEATALWSVENEMSYAELMHRVEGLADALRARRIGPGKVVAIYLERSPEMIIGILGTLTCGAAYLPLDPENPPQHSHVILEDCGPSLLLSGKEGASLGEPLGIECLDPALWPVGGSPGRVPTDGPAYLVYTSGSTGKPKGVVIGHASLENYIAWVMAELPFHGGGVPLFSSISFDHSVTILFPPLMKGETVFLLPSIKRGRNLAENLLAGRHYSYVKITPSHFSLLNIDERARLGCSTDLVMFGGERLPPEFIGHVRRDNPALAVMNHYGPTETTVGCCVYRIPAGFAGVTVPIGQPIPGAITRICRPDLTFAEDGECGELLIGGKVLAEQYWSQPILTQQAFIELSDTDGVMRRWYRTGDLVRRLPDGDLEYLGRNDQQIKILGHRIEPAGIEQLLSSHPQVREAVVFSGDSSLGLSLVAAVRVSEPSVTEQDLKRYLQSRLPPAMLPARILLLQQLPVTTNGKLNRQRLLEMAAQCAEQSHAGIDSQLAARFCDALGVSQVGLDEDFFELGGDSRAIVDIALWVSSRFQINLEVAAFFKYSTVRSLAERIKSLGADAG